MHEFTKTLIALEKRHISAFFFTGISALLLVKFLEVLRPFISILPEVAKPERRVS